MTPEYVVGIGRQAIETTLMCAAPMLIVALVLGLIISIFQAATQINEQTMAFIPKIVGVFVTLLVFCPLDFAESFPVHHRNIQPVAEYRPLTAALIYGFATILRAAGSRLPDLFLPHCRHVCSHPGA